MFPDKVLVINENCSDNIGDHAINEGVKSLLRENGFEPVCVGFDAELKVVRAKKIIIKDGVRDKLRKIKYKYLTSNIFFKYLRWVLENKKRIAAINFSEYKFVIIGGGQLIQAGGTFPIALFKWVTDIKRARVPVYILGVGCAEKFGHVDKQLISIALNKSDGVFLREKRSIDKVNTFFSANALYIPDLAYSLYPSIVKREVKKKYVIIGATSYYVYMKNIKEINAGEYKSLSDYIHIWVELIKKEVSSGEKVVLASTTIDDAVLNEFIYNMPEIKSLNASITLVKDLTSLDEYLDILAQAKRVYSGRMHSLILGHINGCEIRPIRLNKKIDYYLDEYSDRAPVEIKKEISDVFNTLNKDVKC
ncbi:TPA: polysaccharide pyruvyl transferase family protein [Klebsiella pneumoniae]|nr:polysaccharide pyruvyl transferase family protein [Klebsiella pneumoniae]